MVKKQKHQLLDDHLFRQEMAGVVPLKTAPTNASKAPRTANRNPKPEDFSASPEFSCLASADKHGHTDAEDGSSHRKNGIRKRTIQKLKRGRFKIGAELDLHSLTMEKVARYCLSLLPKHNPCHWNRSGSYTAKVCVLTTGRV